MDRSFTMNRPPHGQIGTTDPILGSFQINMPMSSLDKIIFHMLFGAFRITSRIGRWTETDRRRHERIQTTDH